jgi:DNA-binding transcriptional regulator YiaG
VKFRAELRKGLKELGLTPQDFAKKFGMHQSTVRMWHDYASEPKLEKQKQVLEIIKQRRKQ